MDSCCHQRDISVAKDLGSPELDFVEPSKNITKLKLIPLPKLRADLRCTLNSKYSGQN